MTKETTHDVLIVGLGPTGAVLAGLLAQRGVRVAVFDLLDDLFPLPRAVGMDHEAMRIVQELGLADEVSQVIAPYRPSEYLGMDGQPIKRLDAEPPPHRLGWEPNYVFDQPRFEHAIRARLERIDGIDIFKSAEVTAVEQAEGTVEIAVRHLKEDVVRQYSGRYLVACDGGSSPTRKRLGIELEDLGFDEPWLVVDAIVPKAVSDRLPQTQVQYCEAGRPCTFVYCTQDHRRWEIMLDDDEYRAGDFPDEMLWPLLSRWIQPGEVTLWRRAAYRFHGLVARQWRRGNVFLAGDAAHMTPPFMAQGMVQGLRDAHNLAWKMAYVLHGLADDALLDSYETERQPHVRATTLKAMELGRVICERDPDKARLRDQALRQAQGGTIQTTYRQQMIPGLSAGFLHGRDGLAGAMSPQPVVACAGVATRLDDRVGRDFVLYADADAPDFDAAALAALTRGLPIRLVAVAAGDACEEGEPMRVGSGLLHRWMREGSASAVLVRPDRYVFGMAASREALEALFDDLRRGIPGRRSPDGCAASE